MARAEPDLQKRALEPADPRSPGGGAPPARAEGVELLGRYEGSGFKEPPYLVRRGDGQVIQLPLPLYAIVEACDGNAGYDVIARSVTERIGAGIEADDVRMLVDQKLRTIGVLAAPDGSSPTFRKTDPLLGLKFKKGVVPAGLVQALTRVFRPLFFPPVVIAALIGLLAMDIWLFGAHGVAQGVRQTLYAPALLGVLFALVVVAAAFHEIGHATGCAYGGAEPGEMGVGLYVVWPAFYTDVTDAYRLDRVGRLRTDLGGIYFNGLFMLAVFGLYVVTGIEFLTLVILVQHFAVLQQLLPLIRLDGYYIIADLTGVPDMFSRIRPILRGLLPWKDTDDRVKELKWWARAVVTAWVLVLIPAMLFVLGAILLHLPRILATAADSWGRQWGESQSAFGRGDALAGLGSVGELLVLSLPAAAATLTTSRVGKRAFAGGWRASAGKPLARAAFLTGTVGVAALVGLLWWPGERYEPIGPDERWTVSDTAVSFTHPLDAAGATTRTPDETADQATAEPKPTGSAEPGTVEAGQEGTVDDPDPSPDASSSPEPSLDASPSPSMSPSPSTTPTPSSSPTPSPSPSPI